MLMGLVCSLCVKPGIKAQTTFFNFHEAIFMHNLFTPVNNNSEEQSRDFGCSEILITIPLTHVETRF